jgi:predicted RNA binding protein YcfA (HicA-like mRNA interferase family)
VDSISRLRPIKSVELLKILQKNYGYSARKGKGDHIILFDDKHTTVVQTQKELRPRILRAILRETELSWEDIERYL